MGDLALDRMKHVITFEGEQAKKILGALDSGGAQDWCLNEDGKLELWVEE